MSISRMASRAALIAFSAGVALAMAVAPAQAGNRDGAPAKAQVRIQQPSAATVLAGWIGTCYPELYSNKAGGWCDGNGPNWNYRGWVQCTNGNEYHGPWKWAGDRTKSWAYCPSGTSATSGGLDVAYFG